MSELRIRGEFFYLNTCFEKEDFCFLIVEFQSVYFNLVQFILMNILDKCKINLNIVVFR